MTDDDLAAILAAKHAEIAALRARLEALQEALDIERTELARLQERDSAMHQRCREYCAERDQAVHDLYEAEQHITDLERALHPLSAPAEFEPHTDRHQESP